jgi:2-keto-4-pentenoate hydratase/2-oxohepta-3-ene-1,7-dioic acid hydratase in catechol pathway
MLNFRLQVYGSFIVKFVRYQPQKGSPTFGWLSEGQVGPISGSIFGDYLRGELQYPLEMVELLSPVLPSKIIGIGRNYAEHAKEQGVEVPEIPLMFLKPPSSVIGPGEVIVLPPQSQKVEHEAELAVVIGKRARWVDVERASDFILGYTIGNDVTARDLQRRDGQWTRGKGFDTFCPLGPFIETELDPADVIIQCHVNGELRQMGSTQEMIFSIAQLIAYISSTMTLESGDVILTGTPAGIGSLSDGDTVEIKIEGLGILRNPVKAYNPSK